MWSMQTMEYYSAIRKHEIIPFSAIWIGPEIIILSEIRQKQILYDTSYMWNLKKKDKNQHIFKTETHS